MPVDAEFQGQFLARSTDHTSTKAEEGHGKPGGAKQTPSTENQALAAPLDCNSMMEVFLFFQRVQIDFLLPSLLRLKYLRFGKALRLFPGLSLETEAER